MDPWFFAGFGGWSLAQATSIGLLRGVPPGSRHLDVLFFGGIVNLVALGMLWRETFGARTKRPGWSGIHAIGLAATCLWLLLVAVGLTGSGRQVWQQDLPKWKEKMPVYQAAIQQYLATDDSDYLEDNPAPFLKQPKWTKLERILEEKSVQESLSSTLSPPNAEKGAPSVTPTRWVLTNLPSLALPCVWLGSLLLLLGFGMDLKWRNSPLLGSAPSAGA